MCYEFQNRNVLGFNKCHAVYIRISLVCQQLCYVVVPCFCERSEFQHDQTNYKVQQVMLQMSFSWILNTTWLKVTSSCTYFFIRYMHSFKVNSPSSTFTMFFVYPLDITILVLFIFKEYLKANRRKTIKFKKLIKNSHILLYLPDIRQ